MLDNHYELSCHRVITSLHIATLLGCTGHTRGMDSVTVVPDREHRRHQHGDPNRGMKSVWIHRFDCTIIEER
ncbi:hypothetical protein HanRHA438_Chr08g0346291 [Helianthus annuus]|nr:hypothetical protein HanRHA438_Chr08g0346291 [Helianthus annuus]